MNQSTGLALILFKNSDPSGDLTTLPKPPSLTKWHVRVCLEFFLCQLAQPQEGTAGVNIL